MATNWLTNIIDSWDSGIDWTQEELDYLSALLLSICENNNGNIYPDFELTQEQLEAYQVGRVASILDAFVARIARRLFGQPIPMCRVESKEFTVDLPFLAPTRHILRVDLNHAGAEELEKLPGLGPKTAPRVVEYRNRHGRIEKLAELKKVKGLSKKAINALGERVHLESVSESITVTSELGCELIANPTFPVYIAFLKSGEVLATQFTKSPKSLRELIIGEIEGIAYGMENGPALHGLSPGVRATKVRDRLQEDAALRNYIGQNSVTGGHGVLLRDSHYYYFVRDLLKTSNKKIWLIMFFFMFLDEERHPSDDLMQELVDAAKRGVDVKVILDRQQEDDPKPSNVINREAYEYLRANQVPVVYDAEETATHSKLLLVDDGHVVIGSHNWTAGSFFVYRDTSAYVNSEELSAIYESRFDSLWQKYSASSANRGP